MALFNKEEKPKKEKKEVKKGDELNYELIQKPCVTEKSAILGENNFYTFVVAKEANKIGLKDFIEKKYKVDVESVRIINIPRKKKTRGRLQGFKAGFKKAIVRIGKGQKIELNV